MELPDIYNEPAGQISTKIVSTIGPSSRNLRTISSLIADGTNVFRLNFSHGSADDHQTSVDLIREAAAEQNATVAIFQDLQGPKIRLGTIQGGEAYLETGSSFTITTEACEGDQNRASIDYPVLHQETKPGNKILIDDGLVALSVESVERRNIHTRVESGGTIKSRKGVNLPHITLRGITSFTEKDQNDLAFAFENNLEFVALSFVRSAQDVLSLKDHMLRSFGRTIPIIAKIEKPEALQDITRIINNSEAIMVARGDLGVETSTEEVPVIQKNIIRACNLGGIPVITATQMLESMITNSRPTRAEAGDVANAILDGTSAVMLSGETAAGAYPVESVRTIRRIIAYTENSSHFRRVLANRRYLEGEGEPPAGPQTPPAGTQRQPLTPGTQTPTTGTQGIPAGIAEDVPEAVGMAARDLALQLHARYIVCFTHSGGTARLVSKYRPTIPIAALSPVPETTRRLALSWGVFPVLCDELSSVDELFDRATESMQQRPDTKPGDFIIVTAGAPVGSPGKTNMIKVLQL
ncbi:MAG: pyruvate kinase [Spirochaetales bacterium]|nr:pyruvate kinase [Spirochaetales bacterium]MCF7938554.1 pyruvate kinase [Spirochaetales bacterium]